MGRSTFPILLLALAIALAGASSSSVAQSSKHGMTFRQAHQIAVLVARHDNIDLSDTHVEMNSMDLSADFAPGFFSFIVIRESSTPGPDETLRRYAINRRTGDVWEMTLCTHYDFPELARMRHTFCGRNSVDAAEIANQGKHLGCLREKPVPAT